VYVTDRRESAEQFAHIVDGIELVPGRRLSGGIAVLRNQGGLEAVREALESASAPSGACLCIITSQGLESVLRHAPPQSPADIAPFDLVVDDCVKRSGALKVLTGPWRPITIHFVRPGQRPGGESAPLVYRYGLEQAIGDGVLSYPAAARVRPAFLGPGLKAPSGRNVFLAYAHADVDAAARITTALTNAGFRVPGGTREEPGAHALPAILREIRGGDVLVYLLSPDSVADPLLATPLGERLERRGAQLTGK
jgi:hypothetical protein